MRNDRTKRLVAAYRRGTVAAVPAAVLASILSVLAGWPSPLEAAAETLMQWTPLPVADFLLSHLSGIARPAALLGALAGFMLIAGIASLLAKVFAVNTWGSLLGGAAEALVLAYVMVILLHPSTIWPDVWLVIAYVLCTWLLRVPRAAGSNRRDFLVQTGAVLGGAAVLVSLFSIEPLFAVLATRRWFTFRRPSGLRLAGVTDLVTPPGKFYLMDKVLEYPRLGPPGWQLTVGGAVDRPLALDYGAITRLPHENRYITMECVDNPVGGALIGNALWTGVRVDEVLARAGARGDIVVFHGLDDYPESTPVAELKERRALLAFGMNGQTLPREHGYPLRLILPGIYGFKSVKWLTRLEVVTAEQSGTWHAHGWTDTAVIHTGVRIDVARRVAGGIQLGGIAFAGNRGVSAVEVRVNGGAWRRATLGPTLSRESWVQWAMDLRGNGPAAIEARAIDGSGAVQNARRHGPYPAGSSGWARAFV